MHMHTDTLMVFTELDEHFQKGVAILTSYINELRTFMIKFPWKPGDAIDESDVNEGVVTVKEDRVWEELSFEVSEHVCVRSLPDSGSRRKDLRNGIQSLHTGVESLARVSGSTNVSSWAWLQISITRSCRCNDPSATGPASPSSPALVAWNFVLFFMYLGDRSLFLAFLVS